MTHPRIRKISTGFLSGNLFQDARYDERASAENYAGYLEDALAAAFPDIDIEVEWQYASGSLPHALKTVVWYYEDATDTVPWDTEGPVIEEIRQIMSDVFDRWPEWAVEIPVAQDEHVV